MVCVCVCVGERLKTAHTDLAMLCDLGRVDLENIHP